MALVPLRTLAVLFSAGWGGSYAYNHSDTAREIIGNQLARALRNVHASRESRNGGGSDAQGDSSAMGALAEQVSALARDVSRAADRPVVVLGPPSTRVSALADALSLAGWAVLAVGAGSAAYYVAIWKGWSVRDLAWVSQASFDDTVSTMQKGIARVSSALSSVRREFGERMKFIETRVEAVRTSLSRQIEDEVAEVKAGINEVNDEVVSMHDMLAGVDGRVVAIDDKLDNCNNCVMALVRVVSSLAPDSVRPGNVFWDLKQLAEADNKPALLEGANKTKLIKDKQPLLRRRISSGLGGILGKESVADGTDAPNVNLNYANVQIAQTSPR